jgi:nucleoside-triphosphatase THEP1
VNASLKKLAGAIDKIEAVGEIRRELEEAGFETAGMADDQVAELGRKIGYASSRGLR